jgi:hypothetical protein
MLIYGGFFWDGHEKYFDDIFILDLKTGEWKEIAIDGEKYFFTILKLIFFKTSCKK